MGFTFSNANIKENKLVFIYEECEYSGVRKIAGVVRDDIEKVFGAKPIGVESANFSDTAAFFSYPVFFGTVGKSEMLEKLAVKKAVNLFDIAGEREVYSIRIVDELELDGFRFESALVIAGSDKRGTIYGLFRLSEMLGVSPLSGWLDVQPQKLSELTLSPEDSYLSKTPSVKYRGFFINDEWPAFGNYCKRNYGGFNAKVYGKVFELLLRLKGNYLWPAMWTAVFSEDGPQAANCALADELGVIMGTSHHEPCMRQGEEYSHVRGPGSPYGDAWDFLSNREGIIKFWEDGISARRDYENVYTVGMRGEADSAIMGSGATLADNIALLRDVIATQNRLLEEGLGKPATHIPRMFALYKEVEPFFYGDDKTAGLMNDPALEGVTLMLCDDNYGNLRSVPTQEMREHSGGYGMYYHFDYHGAPISYEWINTNYLPKVWEQMTQAYDFGIRDLWIVNVGDIFTHEYPLAFFLDLAYDFEKWGTSERNSATKYTELFVQKNFSSYSDEQRSDIVKLLLGYTKITGRRRTEAMNDDVYAPFAYGESDRTIECIDELTDLASRIYKSLDDDTSFAFYELVYLPLTATMNIQKMWLLTGKNHAYASFGSTYANTLAEEIRGCLKKDKKIVEKLHSIHKGKWYGMGMSEHIGFKNWCEEECQKPVVHTFEPAGKSRLIVVISSSGQHTEGGFWSGQELTCGDALNPLVCGGYIELSTAGLEKVSYEITSEDDFIDIMEPGKSVKCGQLKKVFIFVDRMKIKADSEYVLGHVCVRTKDTTVKIRIPVYNPIMPDGMEQNTYLYHEDDESSYMNYISIGADCYESGKETEAGAFQVIKGYGRGGAAVKAYPQDVVFTRDDAPSVTYAFNIERAGRYNVRLYTSPANPCFKDNRIVVGVSFGAGDYREVNLIPDGYEVRDHNKPWEAGVLANVRCTDVETDLKKGINKITISALSPGLVLEKIVIVRVGCELPYSYLGAPESFKITDK